MVNSGEGTLVANSEARRPVANLPFAQGRVFSSLDEYLDFRKSRGPTDVPWYREVAPGTYELVTRRPPGARPQIFTRDELALKFGFKE